MANFCTNCGTKLRKEDNYCINCGAKVDRSNLTYDHHFKSAPDSTEKKNAKKELKRVVGGILYNRTFMDQLQKNGLDISHDGKGIVQQVKKEIDSGQIKSAGVEFRVNQLIHECKIQKEKEIEEINEKLKMIDEIFNSEEIKSEMIDNKIGQTDEIAIRKSIEYKLTHKKENMSEEEIKKFIKTSIRNIVQEHEKAKTAKEKAARIKKEKSDKRASGGYCGLSCRHCYEEFFDSGGGIVGDFDSDGYTEFYCHLGHPLVRGRYCEDYE